MSEKKVKIGLSYYGSKIQNYVDWLKSFPIEVNQIEIVELHHSNNSPEELLKCTGLVLTGGQDINPNIYNQTNEKGHSRNIDDFRDDFERKLLELALTNKIPVLGICRGLQLTNAHLGGSLFQHIDNHKNNNSSDDLEHSIEVYESTLLHQIISSASKIESNKSQFIKDNSQIVNRNSQIVNSSHHQAVDRVAEELRISAVAPDGVIEALEWKNPEGKSPLLLVQWHPERMKNRNENPFSIEILKWFIKCQIK
ncbi:MAG: gamma-glutamyl-gamma-aminobutyrate hydrolase family protein [Ignavibacteria bacterium]|nr:gamma-glutamyl-gamma-aminobutyrate hydrolase family protein [Ignavibacteria bacterium]